MPEFTLPTTPEQWSAIKPNETDYELGVNWLISHEHPASGAVMAAAARLLERERCVERLAKQLAFDHSETWGRLEEARRDHRRLEARRILEDK